MPKESAHSFRTLWHLEVDPRSARPYAKWAVANGGAGAIGLLASISKFFTLPAHSKYYFAGSLILTVFTLLFLMQRPLRSANYLIGSNLVWLSGISVALGIGTTVPNEQPYLAIHIVIGGIFISILFRMFLFLNDLWSKNVWFAITVGLIYVVFYIPLLVFYTMSLLGGGL